VITTEQRRKLKQSPGLYRLVTRVDVNTRAVAKVVSAAEYLAVPAAEAWPLYAALEGLIHERRELRKQMWREIDRATTNMAAR
jgi:hypothetical protein